MIPTLHPSPTWLLDGCEYAIATLTEIPPQWIDLSDDERAEVARLREALEASADPKNAYKKTGYVYIPDVVAKLARDALSGDAS